MRKKIHGTVVSTKTEKTAGVEVEIFKTHPKYLKRLKIIKKFLADNPDNKYRAGDKVILEETRPLSKKKRFRIMEKL